MTPFFLFNTPTQFARSLIANPPHMKQVATYLVGFIPLTLCLGVAGYLAIKGLDGWGWFLFIALFMTPTFSSKKTKE